MAHRHLRACLFSLSPSGPSTLNRDTSSSSSSRRPFGFSILYCCKCAAARAIRRTNGQVEMVCGRKDVKQKIESVAKSPQLDAVLTTIAEATVAVHWHEHRQGQCTISFLDMRDTEEMSA